jgi:hypothetical protein
MMQAAQHRRFRNAVTGWKPVPMGAGRNTFLRGATVLAALLAPCAGPSTRSTLADVHGELPIRPECAGL